MKQQVYNEYEKEFEMKGYKFIFIENLDCSNCSFNKYPHNLQDFRCMKHQRKDKKNGGFKILK